MSRKIKREQVTAVPVALRGSLWHPGTAAFKRFAHRKKLGMGKPPTTLQTALTLIPFLFDMMWWCVVVEFAFAIEKKLTPIIISTCGAAPEMLVTVRAPVRSPRGPTFINNEKKNVNSSLSAPLFGISLIKKYLTCWWSCCWTLNLKPTHLLVNWQMWCFPSQVTVLVQRGQAWRHSTKSWKSTTFMEKAWTGQPWASNRY